MGDVTLLPEQAADRVGHDEQIQVWAHEIAVSLGMADYLSLETYDSIIDVERIIQDELRDILRTAFNHPEAVTFVRKQQRR